MGLKGLVFAVILGIGGCQEPDYYMSREEVVAMRERVREMFYHGYNNYLEFAFPHDELKPISGTHTDSLAELGNAKRRKDSTYQGVAMTLIDSLDTLAVLGNKTEFARAVTWVVENISFDQDVRVNLFEANIRLLGGLLSAHNLAGDKDLDLMPDYDGELLELAHDLGNRLLVAFQDRYSRLFPYAWVNLKSGIRKNEVSDTCTAGIGTLIMEFGLLSYYTGDYVFYHVAKQALERLWKLKSQKDLFGNTLDGRTGIWTNHNAGIGAGIDSFYEYLFKAYIMFGDKTYLEMFAQTYNAVGRHLKSGPWYVEADMNSARPTHIQFNSLQAFWPGLQVLYGDLSSAMDTQDAFFGVWKRYGALPERYLLKSQIIHTTERYYPLRPEIIESTYYLYRATKDPKYLRMGETMYHSLQNISRVERGYASIKDVKAKTLEDHMTSFFLAELCKYLYLLFDEDNFVHQNSDNIIFSTEGHIFPLPRALHEEFLYGFPSEFDEDAVPKGRRSHMSHGSSGAPEKVSEKDFTCPLPPRIPSPIDLIVDRLNLTRKKNQEEKNESLEAPNPSQDPNHQCAKQVSHGKLNIEVGAGSFFVTHRSGESVHIRNLGTSPVEIVNHIPGKPSVALALDGTRGAMSYSLRVLGRHGQDLQFGASIALFSHEALALVLHDDKISTTAPIPPSPDPHLQVFLEATIVRAKPSFGCKTLENADAVEGKIAYIDRGDCTFIEKVLNAQRAGAAGVIIGNTNAAEGEEDAHFMMGTDGTERQVEVYSVMISKRSADRLISVLEEDEKSGTAENNPKIFQLSRLTHTLPLSPSTPTQTPSATSNINPTPSNIPSKSIKHVSSFKYRTLGEWDIQVQESDNVFLLSVEAL
ncbi:hypothetical protein AAMO2058_000776400 [Amorphochlora amoebiformis]